jgi:hypothetical protein
LLEKRLACLWKFRANSLQNFDRGSAQSDFIGSQGGLTRLHGVRVGGLRDPDFVSFPILKFRLRGLAQVFEDSVEILHTNL